MTVTRCTVRLDSGVAGHAYVAGRDERRAELAAVADALLQDPDAGRRVSDADRAAGGSAARSNDATRGGESGGDAGGVLRHADDAVMSGSVMNAGFADPVARRAALLSRRARRDGASGRIARVSGVTAPAPLGTAAGAVLLTLVDHETPLWLDPDAMAARRWIEFHCGAPVVADPDGMRLRAWPWRCPICAGCRPGSHESPETSATVDLPGRVVRRPAARSA